MQGRRIALALACATTAAFSMASTTFAATPGSTGAGSIAAAKLRAAKPANEHSSVEYGPFSYTDARFGPIECHGKHQTNTHLGFPGNETEGGRDKFVCKSTTGLAMTNVPVGEARGPVTFAGWDSDYFFYVKGETIEDTSISGYVNKRGTVMHAIAYYPAPKEA